MSMMNIVDAIRSTLEYEMNRDERVVVLGLDVGRLGGVFRTTKGLQQRFSSARVIDTPLAEGAIVGTSIGLAVSGLVPVAEIQFLGFTHQGFHQMGAQLGRFRQRSHGRFNAQVTIRAPFGGGIRNPEFHSDALEAQYVQSPGIKVVAPANPYDAKGLLLEAIRDPDPVLFLEPCRLYRLGRTDVPDEEYTVAFGQARVARAGTDVTLVAWSAAVELSLRAADSLSAEGVSAEVIDLRTLVPFDSETVLSSVVKTGRSVVVHEAPLSAGFGAEVAATIQEEGFFSLDAPVARVTGYDVPYPSPSLENWYLPSVDRVVSAVKQTLEI